MGGGAGTSAMATVRGTVQSFWGGPSGVHGGGNRAAKMKPKGTVDVVAASDMYSHAVADGTGGGGIAVTVMIPDAEANGKTLAYAGGGTNVDAGALNITADGKVKGEASNVSLTVGALGGQGSIPTANVGSATDAYVGKNADAGLNMVKVKIAVKGPITLSATSDNTATAHTDGGSGGLATIGVMFPTSDVKGHTRVYVGPETELGGDSLTGTATSTSNAAAQSKTTAIAVFDATIVKAGADAHHDTSAFIGNKSTVTLTGGASLTANATTTATTTALGVSASLLHVGLYFLNSQTHTQTSAFVGEGTTFSGTGLSLTATGTSTPVIVYDTTSLALLGGASGSTLHAQNHSTMLAYLGPAASPLKTAVAADSPRAV